MNISLQKFFTLFVLLILGSMLLIISGCSNTEGSANSNESSSEQKVSSSSEQKISSNSNSLVNPDDYSGTDIEKLQQAFDVASKNHENFVQTKIILYREYDITGGSIKFNISDYTRTPIIITGFGGGFYKNDSGPMFTALQRNTSEITFNDVYFRSTSGKGTYISRGNALINVNFNSCNFKQMDSIMIAKGTDEREFGSLGFIQNIHLNNCNIFEGDGNLFECEAYYGLYLDGVTIENRSGDCILQTKQTGGNEYKSCYQVNITNCLIEGIKGNVASIYSSESFNINGNYFEDNTGNIVVNSQNEIMGLNISGNRLFNSSEINSPLVKISGTVYNVYSSGNHSNKELYNTDELQNGNITSINDISVSGKKFTKSLDGFTIIDGSGKQASTDND